MVDKAEVWRKRVAACRASGLSTAAFCREHELSYAQYMYWQRRLGSEVRGLVPVQVEVARAPAAVLAVEVAVGTVVVRLDGASMIDVVALVRGLSC